MHLTIELGAETDMQAICKLSAVVEAASVLRMALPAEGHGGFGDITPRKPWLIWRKRYAEIIMNINKWEFTLNILIKKNNSSRYTYAGRKLRPD